MQKALFLLGPTGVGKSELAITLAKKFNGQIISADSAQIYRGLNIGTAKLSESQMCGVVHYAIDLLSPFSEFSVYEYVKLTKKLIEDISSKNKLPIIVGGTGLYVKSLVEGYDFGGSGTKTERKELDDMPASELFKILESLDPKLSQQVDPSNKRRLVRAIDLAKKGKLPGKKAMPVDFKVIAVTMPRENLYEKINARTEQMFESGLIEEVKSLRSKGLDKSYQSMQAIGYKETLDYLDGKLTLQELVDLVKQRTRNYAKRQMTFLRGMKVETFDISQKEQLIGEVKQWIKL